MLMNYYTVKTSQVTINVAARNEQAAREQVMKFEQCPESAIKSVTLDVELTRNVAMQDCPILRGYLSTALQDTQFRENDDACEEERQPHDVGTIYTVSDDIFQRAYRDCTEFLQAARDAISSHIGIAEIEGYTNEQCGADFWLTRNGHGAGFWDRSALMDVYGHNIGEALTALVGWRTQWPEIDFYFGDDGNLCQC